MPAIECHVYTQDRALRSAMAVDLTGDMTPE